MIITIYHKPIYIYIYIYKTESDPQQNKHEPKKIGRGRESREANTGKKEKKKKKSSWWFRFRTVASERWGRESESLRDLPAARRRMSSCDRELELNSAYGLFRAEIKSD